MIESFLELFGTEATGVWRAPGRVNLIGEHTDYNDGFVLPFALEQGISVAAAAQPDRLELISLRAPGDLIVVPLDARPGDVTGWAAYPAGVLWALRNAGHMVGGARLLFDSDLPDGAGLSSSAAMECATALALTGLYALDVPRPELAELTQRAENEFVGVPCGILDQSASLLPIENHVLLLDCRSLQTRHVPFAPSGLSLLLIDTQVRHQHVDGEYSARRTACEEAATALGVPALRDATLDDLSRLTDPLLHRRATHIVTENARVREVVDLLDEARYEAIGPFLTASHISMRDDFEITCPELDTTVETALQAGALGARMTGGGFGGSVIALVPTTALDTVTAAVTEQFRAKAWQPPRCQTVTPSRGAHQII